MVIVVVLGIGMLGGRCAWTQQNPSQSRPAFNRALDRGKSWRPLHQTNAEHRRFAQEGCKYNGEPVETISKAAERRLHWPRQFNRA
jgi:hypothetical protein